LPILIISADITKREAAMNTASISSMNHYANTANANQRARKCKVEKYLGHRVAENDLFYHIIKSDIRKLEDREKYGKSGNLAMYFFDVRA
jgi:hypothetical protein